MSKISDAFVLAARRSLSFLENDHGFKLTETIAPPEVRSNHSLYKITYRKRASRSSELFVCLSTAPVRLEQDLEFGRGWPPEYENTINVFELLAIESPDTQITFTSGVYDGFGDPEKMCDQYTALANVLKNHGTRFLANDPWLWDEVQRLRESRNREREYHENSRMAESAFKAGDWQRAIELLEDLGENRSTLQAARLANARKHIRE